MARYDKYDPISGGFRAKLNADLVLVDGEFGPIGVSLNTSGRVIVGNTGDSGFVGVLVKNAARQGVARWGLSTAGTPNPAAPIGALAGDVVDIMTQGEIVFDDAADAPAAAGQSVYAAAATGVLSNTNTGVKVGWMVEATRLIIRVAA